MPCVRPTRVFVQWRCTLSVCVLWEARKMLHPCCTVHQLYKKGLPLRRVGGRWKVEARKDGTTVHTTRCRAHSAHLAQIVHSVVPTAVLCTDMLCACVVHVSRARAVLRFALLRFASRTALGAYLLGLRAKEATCTRVPCVRPTRVFVQWRCTLSVCVLWCVWSFFSRVGLVRV